MLKVTPLVIVTMLVRKEGVTLIQDYLYLSLLKV